MLKKLFRVQSGSLDESIEAVTAEMAFFKLIEDGNIKNLAILTEIKEEDEEELYFSTQQLLEKMGFKVEEQ